LVKKEKAIAQQENSKSKCRRYYLYEDANCVLDGEEYVVISNQWDNEKIQDFISVAVNLAIMWR